MFHDIMSVHHYIITPGGQNGQKKLEKEKIACTNFP